MTDTLLLPFLFPFMQQAFLIAVLAALPMGLLSPFLVLKGWSLMGDAISHAVLPGIVLAYVLGLPLAIGAFAAGMFCAIATGWIKENSRVKEDTVMGIVFSGMFALGFVLYIAITTDIHLDHILFGDVLGSTWPDIARSAIIAALVAAAVGVFGRDLMAHTFDPQHAAAIGLPVRLLHYGLLALVSLSVVGALQATGLVLAIALLIAPGAIAYLLTRRFGVMLVLSGTIAVVSAFVGVYASFFIDSAPAPTIVLTMSIQFIAAFAWSQIRDRRAAMRA
ncbi:MAG: metal ABC transporter permease [Rhizobiaceae bacterium]|nr:metal ABC transporter permease [Rhizobiaceae bacterium]